MTLKYIRSLQQREQQILDSLEAESNNHGWYCLFGRFCVTHRPDQKWVRDHRWLLEHYRGYESEEFPNRNYRKLAMLIAKDRPELAEELYALWSAEGEIGPDVRYLLDSGNPHQVLEDLLSGRERNRAELAAYIALVVGKRSGLIAETLLRLDRPFTAEEREQLQEIAKLAPDPSLPGLQRLLISVGS